MFTLPGRKDLLSVIPKLKIEKKRDQKVSWNKFQAVFKDVVNKSKLYNGGILFENA